MRTCGWKVSICNAVSHAGEPTASRTRLSGISLVHTGAGMWRTLFANGFLAGLNTDGSVNVISAPEALPVKLEPAQMLFDAGALSQGVPLQRCLWFPKTASGWVIFQYKDNIIGDKNKEEMNDPVYSWVIAVCFPWVGRDS